MIVCSIKALATSEDESIACLLSQTSRLPLFRSLLRGTHLFVTRCGRRRNTETEKSQHPVPELSSRKETKEVITHHTAITMKERKRLQWQDTDNDDDDDYASSEDVLMENSEKGDSQSAQELQQAQEHSPQPDNDNDDADIPVSDADTAVDSTKRSFPETTVTTVTTSTSARSARSTMAKSTVRSRMMKNMSVGEQAASLSECIMVIVAGQLLAFNSGFTNGACLSGFLLPSERRQAVSAFTGAYTNSALFLADGDVDAFGFQICMILTFMLGACIAGLLTPQAVQYRIEPTYGPTFLIGAAVLFIASIISYADHKEAVEDTVFYLVAIANGIQNGLSSLYSGNLIRSTHFTGISTDIGLFAGQLIRGNNANNWKLVVLIALTISFWTGGFISYYATQHFTSSTLLFNASLFLTVGASMIVFLIHKYSISWTQALFGTWRWKRALNHLSKLHNNRNALNADFVEGEQSRSFSASMRQGKGVERERLIRLFDIIDADNSGEISPDELLEGLRLAGYGVTMKDIEIMMRFADRDGNGMLSRDDWNGMVREILSKKK